MATHQDVQPAVEVAMDALGHVSENVLMLAPAAVVYVKVLAKVCITIPGNSYEK